MMGEKIADKCTKCGNDGYEIITEPNNILLKGNFISHKQGVIVIKCTECEVEEKIYIGAGLSW